MIVPMLAALALQAQPAQDAADLTLDLSQQCLAVMTGRAEPPAVGTRWIPVGGGLSASVTVSPGGCSFEVEGWRDDSGAFATRLRDGLLADSRHWQVAQWRERQVNESGPTLWTSIVFPDIQRHRAYWVQIIEPEAGAPERLSVEFGIGP